MHARTLSGHDEDRTMYRFTLLAFTLLAASACTTPQDEPPSDDDTTGAATNETQDDGNTLPETGDDGPGTDDTVGTDTNETVDDTTAGDTGENCVGENDCWNCSPNSSEHLLNHCTDATCEPFENSQERLPLLERDGSLPPLP
jgi:hypothetical protein